VGSAFVVLRIGPDPNGILADKPDGRGWEEDDISLADFAEFSPDFSFRPPFLSVNSVFSVVNHFPKTTALVI
jgi:hypothetical protein